MTAIGSVRRELALVGELAAEAGPEFLGFEAEGVDGDEGSRAFTIKKIQTELLPGKIRALANEGCGTRESNCRSLGQNAASG